MRAVLLTIACLAVTACGGGADAPAPETQTIAVTVQPARLETLREAITLPGSVVPSTLADFTVVASESAEILELPHAEGAAVKEGDVLVRFDIPTLTANLQSRQTELTDATQRAQAARAEVARLNGLLEKGIIPRTMAESARTTLAAAEVAQGQAKSALDAAAQLAERATVRSRFAGTVIKVFHKAGDLVSPDPGDPILRVVDPTRTQIAAQAPIAYLERLTPGRQAVVATAAGTSEPASISTRSVPAPSATTAEVRLNLTGKTPLPIDTVVQVDIQLDERKDVIVVPQQAVVRDGSSSAVWIARDDSRAERRPVRIGLAVNGLAQILTGVQTGERVIITGLAQLQDGAPIVVSR